MTQTIDNFTDPAGTDLGSHTPDSGGPWSRTGTTGAFKIGAAGDVLAHGGIADTVYRVPTGSADHYAELSTLGQYQGKNSLTCLRLVDLNNFIGFRWTTSRNEGFKRISGSFTQIQNVLTTVPSTGDIARYQIVGTTVQSLVNGAQIGTDMTVSDAVFSGVEDVGLVSRDGVIVYDNYITAWESDAIGGGSNEIVGASTIAAFASTAAATVAVKAAGASTIAAFTSVGELFGANRIIGAQTIAAFTSSAAAAVLAKLAGASTIPAFTSAGVATAAVKAAGASTIPPFASSAAAAVAVKAAGISQIAAFASAGVLTDGSVSATVSEWIIKARRRRGR